MRLRPWRAAVILVAAAVCGLLWNTLSGRGLALNRNAFLSPGDAIEEIPPAEAKKRLDHGAIFLDARPVDMYALGHIPGALALPEDDLDNAFRRVEPALRGRFDIVVYCSGFGCEASHEVARWLKQKGIAAAVLQEGWPAWTDAGYPTRTGSQP